MLRWQLDVSCGCHDVSMMSMNVSDTAILEINGAYNCFEKKANMLLKKISE